MRKSFISKIVHYLITHCRIETIEEFYEPLVRYRAVMDNEPKEFLKLLKEAVQKFVICSPNVQHLEFKGQKMVVSVFEALNSEPKAFLPRDVLCIYQTSDEPKRVICD